MQPSELVAVAIICVEESGEINIVSQVAQLTKFAGDHRSESE